MGSSFLLTDEYLMDETELETELELIHSTSLHMHLRGVHQYSSHTGLLLRTPDRHIQRHASLVLVAVVVLVCTYRRLIPYHMYVLHKRKKSAEDRDSVELIWLIWKKYGCSWWSNFV